VSVPAGSMMRVDAASLRWRRWRHRVDLLRHLARREFSVRYHDSTLGVLWLLAVRNLVALGLYPPACDHIWDDPWRMHTLLVQGDAPPGQVSGVVDVRRRWRVGYAESSPPGHRAGTS
jgi:hypothetical protein